MSDPVSVQWAWQECHDTKAVLAIGHRPLRANHISPRLARSVGQEQARMTTGR